MSADDSLSDDNSVSADDSARTWSLARPGRSPLELGHRPLVMGVVNVTPDSFSDGGKFLSPAVAVEHAECLLEEGADILDLGAESTRPGGGVYGAGSRELSPAEELDRLLPVLEPLRERLPDACISVDTRKGAVAEAALRAGADLINDVGGLTDPTLVEAVAEHGCPVVIMHSRGELSTMQRSVSYDDVTREVIDELAGMMEIGRRGGIDERQMIVDPGIGFAKRQVDNLRLIAELDRLSELGRPVLLGASRKSFISKVHEAPPDRRLGGSLAAAAWATSRGAAIVRAHDVFATHQLLMVWNAIHSVC